VQLWIVPKNSPPPVAETKEPEPRPEVAVRISQFYDESLKDAAYARRVFQGFADVLNNDEQMQAYIIIRPLNKTAEKEAEDKKWGITRADMYALVESWRTDLEQKYGISRDRLFVVTGGAEEFSGTLETWLVPAGAQPPDPKVVKEEPVDTGEAIDEAEENPQE
jgi:hypothetical protein